MANGDIVVKWDGSNLLKGLKKVEHEFSDRDFSAMTMLLQTAATKMETWAKQNAPWTDRSGAARQRLKGEVFWENKNLVSVAIMHQVDYGIWLELAHQRKYAILEKSLEYHKDDILDSVSILLKKIVNG